MHNSINSDIKCTRCTRLLTKDEADTAEICTMCMKAIDYIGCPKCKELEEQLKGFKKTVRFHENTIDILNNSLSDVAVTLEAEWLKVEQLQSKL